MGETLVLSSSKMASLRQSDAVLSSLFFLLTLVEDEKEKSVVVVVALKKKSRRKTRYCSFITLISHIDRR